MDFEKISFMVLISWNWVKGAPYGGIGEPENGYGDPRWLFGNQFNPLTKRHFLCIGQPSQFHAISESSGGRRSGKHITIFFFVYCRFSQKWASGPIQSLSLNVRQSSVCVCVPSRKNRFLVGWRLSAHVNIFTVSRIRDFCVQIHTISECIIS